MTLKLLETLRSFQQDFTPFVFETIPFKAHRAVVLVVEDDVSLRTTMCAVLTLKNYFPIGAESVESALRVGSTFTIRLPAEVVDPKAQSAPSTEPKSQTLL